MTISRMILALSRSSLHRFLRRLHSAAGSEGRTELLAPLAEQCAAHPLPDRASQDSMARSLVVCIMDHRGSLWMLVQNVGYHWLIIG